MESNVESNMEVDIEEIGPCKNRIKVKLPQKRVAETFSKHFKDLKSAVKIKGFRPGKVPRSYIQRRFGSEITNQVKMTLVEESLEEVLKENKLDPIGEPEIDLGKILVDADQDLEYEAVIEVRPAFELGDYTGIQVERQGTEVTQENLDEEMLQLRRRHASLEPIEGDEVGEEDVLFGSATVLVGDRKVTQAEDVTIGPQTVSAAGIIVKDLRERALGAGIGGSTTFDVTLPRYHPKEEFRNKEGKMILSVQEGKKVVLPDADEEFAKRLDFDDMDELTDKIREALQSRKEMEADKALEDRIIEKILESTPFSVPEGLVSKETERVTARTMLEMEFSGQDPEEIQTAVEESSEMQKAEVERILKTRFLLDAIGKKEKIYATEEDVKLHIMNIASREGKDPEEVRKYYEDQNMLSEVRYYLREAKIRNHLRENAEIT